MVVFEGNELCPWSELWSNSHFNARLIVFKYFAKGIRLIDEQWKYLCNFFHIVIKGITSLSTVERAMYSASAVLKAISLWTLLTQYIGQPA
jgi:hypothetical protein